MKSISELQELCNFAVSISMNDLMIDWIGFLKTQSNNKSIVETYDLMISKLQEKFVFEFDDPASIADLTWGIGSKEQFLPISDIHEIYYMWIQNKISQYFTDKIFILSTDAGFQIKAQNILNNLETFFTIPRNILYDKRSRESSFHNLKGIYSTWLKNRDKTQETMNVNFENLKKLVDEYS